jgi:predicted dehydrogenase
MPNAKIVALSDKNESGRLKTGAKLKVDKLYADYRAMLDEVKPDIFVIGSRYVDQHAEQAIAAAERGVHIYMEKPMCRSLVEADAIIAACEKTHVKVQVIHPTRFSPLRDRVAWLIKSGEIGEPLEYRGRGKEDHRGGGEDLWVLGTHVLDMIHTFSGSPKWCFAELTQMGAPVAKRDVREGNEGLGPLAGDACRAVFGMSDGTTAYFNSKKGAGRKQSRYGLQIFGTDGVIELLEGTLAGARILRDSAWSPGRTKSTWKSISSAGIDLPEPIADLGKQERHVYAMRDLIEAIENNREPKGGMHAGRAVVEMISAVFESHRRRAPIDLPLVERRQPLSLL